MTNIACSASALLQVGGKPKDPLKAAALGALSTSIAQVFTTPLDVGRNRIMSSRAKGQVPAPGESGENIISVCNVASPPCPQCYFSPLHDAPR